MFRKVFNKIFAFSEIPLNKTPLKVSSRDVCSEVCERNEACDSYVYSEIDRTCDFFAKYAKENNDYYYGHMNTYRKIAGGTKGIPELLSRIDNLLNEFEEFYDEIVMFQTKVYTRFDARVDNAKNKAKASDNTMYDTKNLITNRDYRTDTTEANYTNPHLIDRDLMILKKYSRHIARMDTLVRIAKDTFDLVKVPFTNRDELHAAIDDAEARIMRISSQQEFLLFHLPHYQNYLTVYSALASFTSIEKYINELHETCIDIITNKQVTPAQALASKYSRASEVFFTINNARKAFLNYENNYNQFMKESFAFIPARDQKRIAERHTTLSNQFSQTNNIFHETRKTLGYPPETINDFADTAAISGDDTTFNIQYTKDKTEFDPLARIAARRDQGAALDPYKR
jgi:hypothetical protein